MRSIRIQFDSHTDRRTSPVAFETSVRSANGSKICEDAWLRGTKLVMRSIRIQFDSRGGRMSSSMDSNRITIGENGL